MTLPGIVILTGIESLLEQWWLACCVPPALADAFEVWSGFEMWLGFLQLLHPRNRPGMELVQELVEGPKQELEQELV
jgi:hypothetical protein